VRLRGSYPDFDYLLEVAGKVALTPWPAEGAGSADEEIHLPTEALLRLMYGRLDAVHTPPADVIGATGLLDQVRAVFPGY
jgi:hypothetical protein